MVETVISVDVDEDFLDFEVVEQAVRERMARASVCDQ